MSNYTRRNVLAAAIMGGIGLLTACGGVKTSGGSGGGGSSDYPKKDIETSVGFAPGGSTDVMARALTEPVGAALGITMPIVNSPGANGVLAAKELTQKEPDGYTVGVVNASTFTITPLAVAENEKVAIDDLDIILGFTQDDYILVANSNSKYKSIDDLKKAGKKLSYGTTGVGGGGQLCAALTFGMAKIDGDDVPFEGDAPALTAVLGEQVDVASVQLAAAKEYLDSGEVHGIAVFSEEPLEQISKVKTAKQQGLDFAVSQWRTLCAPKGTDENAKKVLLEAFTEAVKDDAFVKFCEKRLLQPTFFESKEMTKMLTESADRYQKLIDEHGIKLSAEK